MVAPNFLFSLSLDVSIYVYACLLHLLHLLLLNRLTFTSLSNVGLRFVGLFNNAEVETIGTCISPGTRPRRHHPAPPSPTAACHAALP